VKESHDFLSPSPSPSLSPNFGHQSESESDEMAGSEKLWYNPKLLDKVRDREEKERLRDLDNNVPRAA
jgi:hypothetical protein